jgi:hypothetical protein
MKTIKGILLSAVIAYSLPVYAGVLFDFENLNAGSPLSGQGGWTGATFLQVGSEFENQFLKFPSAPNPFPITTSVIYFTPSSADLGGSNAASGLYTFSFDIRADSAPAVADFNFVTRISIGSQVVGDSKKAALCLRVYSNGFIEFDDGAAVRRIRLAGNVTSGDSADLDIAGFHTISGVLDYDSMTFTISYDGVQMQNGGNPNFAFNPDGLSSFASFGNIQILTPYNQTAYRELAIDNISITAVPEPAAFAALLGCAGLLICLRRHFGKRI